MQDKILVINSGSTSLKYKLFNNKDLEEEKSSNIQNIGKDIKDHKEALEVALKEIGDLERIKVAGHRVVHGGEEFVETTEITTNNLKELEKYNELAPLHNPSNLMGIEAAINLLPDVSNYACFDTAFYKDLEEKVYKYAIPEKFAVRKYGFHGLSHQYVTDKCKGSGSKIISCHLGGGCSITASMNEKAIDTSMGFTPMEGLIMMSRSGDIDPGVITYLQRKENLSAEEIDKILNFESGIYGICGEKDWLKVLERVEEGDKLAILAFDMFCLRIQKYIGAYYAELGGLDVLIFTGSIGSGDEKTRKIICEGLPFLEGVKIEAIETNEELQIAKEITNI
ncbi:MAG: acetate/propionate family kinase [Parcubacteria group bacterium]|nr:acetate/propionate family kinase [Parcubacteria group bacterium]